MKRAAARIDRLVFKAQAIKALRGALGPRSRSVEACGLLGGTMEPDNVGLVTELIPLRNLWPGPNRFAIDPENFARAATELAARGVTSLALYHTHPIGPGTPSSGDRDLLRLTELLQVIVYREGRSLGIAAYGKRIGVTVAVPVAAMVE